MQIIFIMKPQLKIINFMTEKKEHIYLTEGLKGKTIDWPMTGETMLINQFGRKGVIRRNRIYEIRLSLEYQSINRYCSGVNVLRYVSLNLIKTPFRLVLWNKSSQTIYNYFTEKFRIFTLQRVFKTNFGNIGQGNPWLRKSI